MEENYVIGARPADDIQLKTWALAHPGVVSFATERRGDDLCIRSERHGSLSQRPTPEALLTELRRLGYESRGMRGGSNGMMGGFREILTHAFTLALLFWGSPVRALASRTLGLIRGDGSPNEAGFPYRDTFSSGVGPLNADGGSLVLSDQPR